MSENKQPVRPPMGGPMRGPRGGPPGARPGEKAKDFSGTMKKLLKYIRSYIPVMLVVFVFAIFSTIFATVGPKILGKATDIISKFAIENMVTHNAVMDFAGIRDIMLFLITLYLISAALGYVQSYIMAGVSQKISYRLRKDIIAKIEKLPLKYFDTKSHGDVLSRVTNDVDTVSQTLNQSLSQIITSFVTLVGVLIMMISIDLSMTAVGIISLPVSFFFVTLIVKKSQKYFKQQQRSLANVNGHVEEMYSGHTVMKAFNGEERSIEKFTVYNDALYEAGWKSQFLSGLMMPIMKFIGNLGYVAISVLGGFLAIKGTVSIGNVQAFLQYIRQLDQPVNQVAMVMNILQSTAAAAERVFEFLEEPEEVPESTTPLLPEKLNGAVEFKNVHFGYKPEKIIINDFSANIKPGQKIAIVGPTGAGKTTIVKLLMRFYELNGGSILIDGVDIKDMKRSDLRHIFGMVLQDTWLYNGTIMENIRYGRLDATDEEVINAAKSAHADHFIRTLPDGYNLMLNEEAGNVSQGQKQLLTIARAILADPQILILDEATSSVDTRTEVLIQKAMANLMKGRTSFIIAHRLSTIRDADMILVMNNGDIVEQGSHEDLLKANGFYAKLYNSQFESNE
ncbi:MAG: ABC transporter ATP-binding protein [Clostridia bacterium]|nr:ABC transporter ATP-binding protein [Clostridia bacterium]